MKVIGVNTVLNEFEKAALEGLDRIRAFWETGDVQSKAFEDAKLGSSTISAYTRLRATMANEQAIELAFRKVNGGRRDPKRLKA